MARSRMSGYRQRTPGRKAGGSVVSSLLLGGPICLIQISAGSARRGDIMRAGSF